MVAEGGGGPGQTVNADRPIAAEWERFQIVTLDGTYTNIGSGNYIALRTYLGYYVVAEYGGLNGGGPGAGDVNCDRTHAAEWETFRLLY